MERAELLESLRGRRFPVLDQGWVALADAMGDDRTIVDRARGTTGTTSKSADEDRTLLRRMMRHHHGSSFEFPEVDVQFCCPFYSWRQTIRHRAGNMIDEASMWDEPCLAEGTRIYFDKPSRIRKGDTNMRSPKIEDLWEKMHGAGAPWKRKTMRAHLRQADENTLEIRHTRIVDVYRNGRQPVFRMTLADGKQIECTANHRFMFSDGWKSLRDATGLSWAGRVATWNFGDYFVYVNGTTAEVPAVHQDAGYLRGRYIDDRASINEIADECGVSYHTIRKWLTKHGLTDPGRSCFPSGNRPWNTGKRYKTGPKDLSPAAREAMRAARAGAASNFWKGGMSSERESIGRWTSQAAHRVHARNGWTCQLCHQRAGELHAHHVVPVWADISRARDESNLTTVCGDCHRSVNGRELEFVERLGGPHVRAEWVRRPRVAWNKLTVAKLVRIERFEYVGEKETYDIEVEGPFHNFVANGIVTHNSVNELSGRYSEVPDLIQATPPDGWRKQSRANRQGSLGRVTDWPEGYEVAAEGRLDPGDDPGRFLSREEDRLHGQIRAFYETLLHFGVAREQARKVWPLGGYTVGFCKMDLRNWLSFLALRLAPDAQAETRAYAEVVAREIIAPLYPVTYAAFEDYVLNAITLSALDIEAIRRLQAGEVDIDGIFENKRERDECRAKLVRLGLVREAA